MEAFAGGLPTGRDGVRLVLDQLAAVAAWQAAVRSLPPVEATSREERLDAARREAALQRERAALVARAALHLEQDGPVRPVPVPVRAVLAHRDPWLRDRVGSCLQELGVRVAGSFDDGADAAGTVVAEQPDVLLVEDRLPTLTGLQVVERARAFAPRTLVGVQVDGPVDVAALTDAGARAVFARRVPPRDVAAQLVACLDAPDGTTVALR